MYLGILQSILTISASKPHSEEPEKKKKKRKREEQEDETGATVETSTSESKKAKKDKKKRRKEEAASTSTSAEAPSSPSKAVPPPAKSAPKAVASASDAAAFLEKHSVTITTPPGVPAVIPITDFAQLDVPEELSSSFKGFKEPTPIQACTWPPALEGRDVVGIAETGRCMITHSLIFPYTNHPIAVKLLPSVFLHSAASSIHRQRLQSLGNQQ
jgi:ATP-dependent RNA helicase DBP3